MTCYASRQSMRQSALVVRAACCACSWLRTRHHERKGTLPRFYRLPARIGVGGERANNMITLANQLEEYIGGLILVQGRHAGQPFRLQAWQRRFLRGAFAAGQDDDAGASLARGGGKTTLAAAIGCAALDGPLMEPNAESIIIAASFEQGLVCFRHVLAFMRPRIEREPRRWRVQVSVNRASLGDRETGAVLKVVGSKPASLHGIAPKLMILDELAQWQHTTIDSALAALETSRGKVQGSRALWLGTRPSSPEHAFEKALQGGLGYSQVHAARESDSPFARATWKKANPGLDDLPDLEATIRRESKRAREDPALMQAFKALRLNQGVSDVVESLLLSADVWERIESDAVAGEGEYVLGLDIGSTQAQSAAAAFWPQTGALDCFAVFPSIPSLSERGLSDGVGGAYSRMAQRGELLQAGQRVSDVDFLLKETLERWGTPACIVADRYREAEVRQALDAANFPQTSFVTRGQGWKDGAEDVRRFQRACLDGYVHPRKSLLLRSAMGNARVVMDASANAKLAKASEGRRAGARDDAAAAGILCVAEAMRSGPARTNPASLRLSIVGQ